MEPTVATFTKIDFREIPYYSEKDIAYQSLDPRYSTFYKYKPEIEVFAQVIDEKKKQKIDRALVVRALEKQYATSDISNSQKENIQRLLEDNTYTVITAHQPSLFTGPLYFIYKICAVIKLARQLNEKYSESHIVPLFISGGEDHDFEEINHAQLFNKVISWNNDTGGPVGRIKLDEDFNAVITEFTEILGEKDFGPAVKAILESAYAASSTYAEFSFYLVNQLFSKYGLLVLNMDKPELKSAFIPAMTKELIERPSQKIVQSAQEKLTDLGFKSQAFPRDINLFYLQEGRRDRITFNNGKYEVVDTDTSFSESEILEALNNNPEFFSPNVVLRPLYQESVLPNLAYIGGGGEIAYWLERKDQFEEFNIPFPMLIRRNSALLVTENTLKQTENLDTTILEMSKDIDLIINNFLHKNTDVEIDLSVEKDKFNKIFDAVSLKAETIDPTLSKWIQAEKTKQIKIIDQMESRLKRSVKQREEITVNQLRKLKEKLFPGNGLQERKENFFQYYLQNGPGLIDQLIEIFEPLDNDFVVVEVK